MAEDNAGGASPKVDTEPTRIETREDEETRAARHELKQSSISDAPAGDANDPDKVQGSLGEKDDSRPATPKIEIPSTATDDAEQVMSPKKKRAHDQLEQDKVAVGDDAASIASTDSARDRASRSEPEKKRARDGEQSTEDNKAAEAEKNKDVVASAGKTTSSTSASTFASSTFGKLATSSSSPFAALGSSKPGGFGSAGAKPLSSFASSRPPADTQPAATSTGPKMTFGGGNAASPFASLPKGSNGFGSSGATSFGSGKSAFSSVPATKPLSSFASSVAKPFQSEKPAKPFGAPDSDADESDNSAEGEEDEASNEEAERPLSPEKESDDKRKLKLQKVQVNDGEAGETTLISVRAKMFEYNTQAGWKERGSGMLKINVPESCVDFDDSGAPIPGTFDASSLDDADDGPAKKVVRLLMRQDQTHRVILNTAVLPVMNFQEKSSLKSVGILFPAFEGAAATPVTVTMRMSAANAKIFMNEIKGIQKELQGI
jgi:hypothetical protein